MTFHIVFHWGPKATLDYSVDPVYTTAFRLWPNYAQNEKRRFTEQYADKPHPTVAIYPGLGRSKGAYEVLNIICLIARRRRHDKDFQSANVFIPTSIRVVHIFTDGGDRLPWAQLRPTQVWKNTPPGCLRGLSYDVVLHKSQTDEDPTPIEDIRREWYRRKYERRLAYGHKC